MKANKGICLNLQDIYIKKGCASSGNVLTCDLGAAKEAQQEYEGLMRWDRTHFA
jgi:hypothetical protein